MAQKVRRRIRHEGTVDGVELYKTRSFNPKTPDLEYFPAKDQYGRVRCTCDGFLITKLKQARAARVVPTVWTPSFWCRHLFQLVSSQRKSGLIPRHPDELNVGSYLLPATPAERQEYQRICAYACEYGLYAAALPEDASSGQAQRWIRIVSEKIEDET